MLELLEAAGFADSKAVTEASDEALLDIDGIGPSTLAKIREAIQ